MDHEGNWSMNTEAAASVILRSLSREGPMVFRELRPRHDATGRQTDKALAWLKRRKLVEFDSYWRLTERGKIACRANGLEPA